MIPSVSHNRSGLQTTVVGWHVAVVAGHPKRTEVAAGLSCVTNTGPTASRAASTRPCSMPHDAESTDAEPLACVRPTAFRTPSDTARSPHTAGNPTIHRNYTSLTL